MKGALKFPALAVVGKASAPGAPGICGERAEEARQRAADCAFAARVLHACGAAQDAAAARHELEAVATGGEAGEFEARLMEAGRRVRESEAAAAALGQPLKPVLAGMVDGWARRLECLHGAGEAARKARRTVRAHLRKAELLARDVSTLAAGVPPVPYVAAGDGPGVVPDAGPGVLLHLSAREAAILRHVVWNAAYDVAGPDMAGEVKGAALRIVEALPPVEVRAEWFEAGPRRGRAASP